MYAFESKVRYSEVGEDTRMTLYSVLNYFQDCSVFHSESVGRGTAVQEELGRAWVLTGWQIEFRRAAEPWGKHTDLHLAAWIPGICRRA